MFASEIRRKRVHQLRAFSKWRWHVDEVFVKINGERHYLWRAADHEGEVLESVVTTRRNKRAALKMLRKLMRRYGRPEVLVTDRFPSYKAALRELGCADLQSCGRWLNNRVENSYLPFRRRERAMRRFRRMRSLQKFVTVHSSVFNTSTRNAASPSEIISRPAAPLLLPSGAVFARHKGQAHCPCRNWFAFV